MPPVTKTATAQEQDDGTRPFRRPEQPTQAVLKKSIGNEAASAPEKQNPDQGTATGTVRRRRTERNHYDEDGF